MFLVNETPSGNVSITEEARTVITFTRDDGCSTTVAGPVHFHTLLKSDALFEDQALTHQVVTSEGASCGFPPFICTSSEHVHLANGAFQYDRFETVCEPL